MSWNAKVHWTEGLFLRPHHLQQGDRYLESAIESRARHVTPYPWGFAELEIDRDLAQQSKFALRRAAGVMPDGGLFDFPAQSPAPTPIDAPEAAAGQLVWLTMPARADNAREVSPERSENAARYVVGAETVIDSTSHLRIEEEIEVAYPRLAYEIRKTAKPGYVGLPIARIVEVHDRTLVFDEKFAPPLLVCAAHPTVEG
jgi:type VI secretion system protein ImpJ